MSHSLNDALRQRKEWLDRRFRRVEECAQQLLEAKTGTVVPPSSVTPPRIGLAFSGGGFRAMLSAAVTFDVMMTTSHCGLQPMDFVSYVSGVSGGSWATLLTFASLIKRLRPKAAHGNPFHSDHGAEDFSTFHKACGSDLIDVLRACWRSGDTIQTWEDHLEKIASTVLGSDANSFRVSDLRTCVEGEEMNLPLFSCAAIADNDDVHREGGRRYDWISVDPFVVQRCRGPRAQHALMQAPTNTVSGLDRLPRLMAACGSAFAFDLDSSGAGHTLIRKFVSGAIPVASVVGFSNTTHAEEINHVTTSVRDAGIDFNIPVPLFTSPGFGQTVDLLIVVDSSSGSQGADELFKAESLSHISLQHSTTEDALFQLFAPSDGVSPTVLFVKGLTRHSTFSEEYNEDQISQYAAACRSAVLAALPTFWDVVASLASNKKLVVQLAPQVLTSTDLRSRVQAHYRTLIYPRLGFLDDERSDFDMIFTQLQIPRRNRNEQTILEARDIWSYMVETHCNCVLLEGAPGGGKSSLLRHIAREQGFSWPVDLVLLLPVQHLTDAVVRDPTSIRALVANALESATVTAPNELVEAIASHIETKGVDSVLWLLDGFDEVAADTKSNRVDLFFAQHVQSSSMVFRKVVVASRTSHVPYWATACVRLAIAPWDAVHRHAFVVNYSKSFPDIQQRLAQTIDQFFREQPGMSHFEGNPLVTHLLCAALRHHLLNGRTSVVTVLDAFEFALQHFSLRERGRVADTRHTTPWSLDQVANDMGGLAWHLIATGSTIDLTFESADSVMTWGFVKPIFARSPAFKGKISVDFVHRTFAELVAAAWLTLPNKEGQISFPKDFCIKNEHASLLAFVSMIASRRSASQPRFVTKELKRLFYETLDKVWPQEKANLEVENAYGSRQRAREKMGIDALVLYLAMAPEAEVEYFVTKIRSRGFFWSIDRSVLQLFAEPAGRYASLPLVQQLGSEGADIVKRCLFESSPLTFGGSRILEYCASINVRLDIAEIANMVPLETAIPLIERDSAFRLKEVQAKVSVPDWTRDLHPRVIALFAVCGGLPSLDVANHGLGDDQLRILWDVAARPNSKLMTLIASQNDLGLAMGPLISRDLARTSLTSLDLSDNPNLTDAVALHLAEAIPFCSLLTSLSMHQTGLSPVGVEALVKTLCSSNLLHLDLRNNQFRASTLVVVQEVIEETQVVPSRTLFISVTDDADEGNAAALGRRLKLESGLQIDFDCTLVQRPALIINLMPFSRAVTFLSNSSSLKTPLRILQVQRVEDSLVAVVSAAVLGDAKLRLRHLTDSQLFDASLSELLQRCPAKLTELDLDNNSSLSSAGMSTLAKGLKCNSSLMKLTLDRCINISDEGLRNLMSDLPQGCKLTNLCLRQCSIGDVGMLALTTALRNLSLKTLDLSINLFTAPCFISFCEELLKSPSKVLQKLSVSRCKLGDNGVRSVIEAVKRGELPSMVSIDVSATGFSAKETSSAIGEMIATAAVVELNLSENTLHCELIAQHMSPTSSLTNLDVSACNIDDESGACFCDALSKSALRIHKFVAKSNQLQHKFSEAIGAFLLTPNCSLTLLDVADNALSQSDLRSLKSAAPGKLRTV